MAAERQQTGPIAVYGATGYTGRLVAAELDRRGAELVISGRDRGKLEALAATLGDVRVAPAALDDPAALGELLEPCAAVIACAGPFVRHGEPVLRAAVETATHYVDTSGEQPFIRRVFDAYGPRASEAGVALLTAMGFDYAPGDLIAALTAAGVGEELDEVVLAYAVSGFGPSRGTTSSALGMIAGGDVEWRDGALRPGSSKVGRGWFAFPPPVGRRRVTRYPSGEHVTVPRHVRTRSVRTLLTAATTMPHPRLEALAPVTMPAVQLAMRTPLRRAIEAAVARLPEGPSEDERRAARWLIVCEARRGATTRRGVVRGTDVYGITAQITAEAALRMAAPGFGRSGALAPAQAFDAREFLDALAEFGVSYELDPVPAAA